MLKLSIGTKNLRTQAQIGHTNGETWYPKTQDLKASISALHTTKTPLLLWPLYLRSHQPGFLFPSPTRHTPQLYKDSRLPARCGKSNGAFIQVANISRLVSQCNLVPLAGMGSLPERECEQLWVSYPNVQDTFQHKLMTYGWDIPLLTFPSGANVRCLNCLIPDVIRFLLDAVCLRFWLLRFFHLCDVILALGPASF